MKRWTMLAVLFVLLPMVTDTIAVSAEKKMLFVYYHDYAPFSWEEDGTMRGIYIDIVNEVFTNRLGFPIEHRGYPWKRAQKMVQHGDADGYCTVITSERLSFSDATQESIIDVNFKIYTSAKSPKLDKLKHVKSLSELQEFKLVDYLGSGWAKEHLENANLDVHWLTRNELLWRFLIAGRADATVKNEWTTRYGLKKLGLQEQIVELPHPMTSEPVQFHIFIGKRSSFTHVLKQVNKAIHQIKEDGTLQKIYDKYK